MDCIPEIIHIHPGKITGKCLIINAYEFYNTYKDMSHIYNIRVQSPFVLTPRQVKDKLGIGHKVLSVEVEKEPFIPEIVDKNSALQAIMKIGYKSLVRANHPDLGGSNEIMILLNQSKKELEDLLEVLNA